MADPASPVRLGLIGCGRIGSMHADLIGRPELNLRLVAAFDEVPEAASGIAKAHGAQACVSADALFERPDVDAVAICASTDAAAGLVEQAVAAGKPTFVEKPVAFTAEPLTALASQAAAAGVPVAVGFNRRFDPHHGEVARQVHAGTVGQLEVLRITSRDPSPPPAAYVARSGGVFVDMAIHDFDMARFVTGSDVVSVSATGACLIDPAIGAQGDFDTAAVTLTHTSGALTVVDLSRRTSYGYDQRVEAFGSAAQVASANPRNHQVSRRDEAGSHGATVPYFFTERYADAYVAQWQTFARLASGEDDAHMPNLSDAAAAVAIATAATESANTGRTVSVAGVSRERGAH